MSPILGIWWFWNFSPSASPGLWGAFSLGSGWGEHVPGGRAKEAYVCLVFFWWQGGPGRTWLGMCVPHCPTCLPRAPEGTPGKWAVKAAQGAPDPRQQEGGPGASPAAGGFRGKGPSADLPRLPLWVPRGVAGATAGEVCEPFAWGGSQYYTEAKTDWSPRVRGHGAPGFSGSLDKSSVTGQCLSDGPNEEHSPFFPWAFGNRCSRLPCPAGSAPGILWAGNQGCQTSAVCATCTAKDGSAQMPGVSASVGTLLLGLHVP